MVGKWYLYIVETAKGTLYTGITTDVQRRFEEHSSSPKGAKYLKGKGPLVLLFSQEVGDKSLASKLEYQVKKLKRAEKEQVISGSRALFSLLDES